MYQYRTSRILNYPNMSVKFVAFLMHKGDVLLSDIFVIMMLEEKQEEKTFGMVHAKFSNSKKNV